MRLHSASSAGRGALCMCSWVSEAHSLSAADITAAGRVVMGEMTGRVGAKPS